MGFLGRKLLFARLPRRGESLVHYLRFTQLVVREFGYNERLLNTPWQEVVSGKHKETWKKKGAAMRIKVTPTRHRDNGKLGLNLPFPAHLSLGLDALVQASDYAHHCDAPIWTFALTYRELRNYGLIDNDLRFLLLNQLLMHGAESTEQCAQRKIDVVETMVFGEPSSFILTKKGYEWAQRLLRASGQAESDEMLKPIWDGDRHRLTLSGTVVKEFKLPSPNQECILSAFQAADWPPSIDDPLPFHAEFEPKRRLNDTIKGLNRNQKDARIRFCGDGTGCAVLWEFA